MQKVLFGVAPVDPVTYASVAALTFLVTLSATLIPAAAAARLDPTVTLRSE